MDQTKCEMRGNCGEKGADCAGCSTGVLISPWPEEEGNKRSGGPVGSSTETELCG